VCVEKYPASTGDVVDSKVSIFTPTNEKTVTAKAIYSAPLYERISEGNSFREVIVGYMVP